MITLKKKDFILIESTLKNNSIWDRFFSFRFPSSTIPHELEHLRRNSDHLSGHDSTMKKIIASDKGVLRTFDQAVNFVYQEILTNGFFEKFFKAY